MSEQNTLPPVPEELLEFTTPDFQCLDRLSLPDIDELFAELFDNPLQLPDPGFSEDPNFLENFISSLEEPQDTQNSENSQTSNGLVTCVLFLHII